MPPRKSPFLNALNAANTLLITWMIFWIFWTISMTFLSSVTIFSMRVLSLLQMPMTLFSSSRAFMMFAPSQAATVAPNEHHDVARAARNDWISHCTNILTRSMMQLATWTHPLAQATRISCVPAMALAVLETLS